MRWLALLLFLTGCATPIVWDEADTPQFKTDDYECTRDATYTPGKVPVPDEPGFAKGFAEGRNMRGPQVNRDLYIMCMESRGYEIDNLQKGV